MIDLLIAALIGLAIGFAAGARWYWRIVDKALREFENDHGARSGGSTEYRIARLVK